MMAPLLEVSRLAGSSQTAEVLLAGPSLGTSVEALWSRCAATLRFEVVGWDLPGHGRSGPACEAFSVSDLANTIRELAQAVAYGRHAWYAGVSPGGAMGLQLALDPGPFGAAAVLASAPKTGDAAAGPERADLVRHAGIGVMVAGSAVRWFAPGFADREPAGAGTLLTSLSDTDRESYALACGALASFDLRDRVSAMKVPLLVAAGEHDPVVPPGQARSAVPDAFAVLAGCGHLPPSEDPAAAADLLTSFFRSAKAGVDTVAGRLAQPNSFDTPASLAPPPPEAAP